MIAKRFKKRARGLRVIGGKLRGKKLQSVRGMTTRPTMDRVRESIFNILSLCISAETVVLDLFAGTGVMGIEALSRGARFALFVDNGNTQVQVIHKNLRSCRLAERGKIVKRNIEKGLPWLKSTAPPFDLVFMDPPYHQGLIEYTLRHLHHSHSMVKGAMLVIEHDSQEPIPDTLPQFILTDQRKYGKTLVSFVRYNI